MSNQEITTIQFRNMLRTANVDPAMIPRILGAMGGKWSRQDFLVTDWLATVSASGSVKPDVIATVRRLMDMGIL